MWTVCSKCLFMFACRSFLLIFFRCLFERNKDEYRLNDVTTATVKTFKALHVFVATSSYVTILYNNIA